MGLIFCKAAQQTPSPNEFQLSFPCYRHHRGKETTFPKILFYQHSTDSIYYVHVGDLTGGSKVGLVPEMGN